MERVLNNSCSSLMWGHMCFGIPPSHALQDGGPQDTSSWESWLLGLMEASFSGKSLTEGLTFAQVCAPVFEGNLYQASMHGYRDMTLCSSLGRASPASGPWEIRWDLMQSCGRSASTFGLSVPFPLLRSCSCLCSPIKLLGVDLHFWVYVQGIQPTQRCQWAGASSTPIRKWSKFFLIKLKGRGSFGEPQSSLEKVFFGFWRM